MIESLLFFALVFCFSLVSTRVKGSMVTAPMVFTLAGIAVILWVPAVAIPSAQVRAVPHINGSVLLVVGELILAVILFSDATRITFSDVISGKMMPARLLAIGMPLTILVGSVVGAVAGLSLWDSAILATVLAPTDAGLGEAVVESDRVPRRVREALTVESGLNDGLSMPFLVLFLALAGHELHGGTERWIVFTLQQIGLGVAVGLVVGLLGGHFMALCERRRWMDTGARELAMLALAILSWLGADGMGGNGFIAAFVGGAAVHIGYRRAHRDTVAFMEGGGDLIVYFVFFYFGLVAGPWLSHISASQWLYAVASLTIVRMLPVALALTGVGLRRSSVLFMGWFGPRGLASIVLGLIYLEGLSLVSVNAYVMLAMIATVLLSIMAHGLSANPLITWYGRRTAELDRDSPELA
jgi:NhaP-type Na+/H+ or K+/H+ antiporter